jgi:hypothetical protein
MEMKNGLRIIKISFYYPSSVIGFPLTLTVNRSGDNKGDAKHNRADNDAERDVLIFLDFFVNIKNSAHNRVRDGKENQTDKNKN